MCSNMQGLLYRPGAAPVSQHISGNCFSRDHLGFLLGWEFLNSECLWVCCLALLGRIHHLESVCPASMFSKPCGVQICITQHVFSLVE